MHLGMFLFCNLKRRERFLQKCRVMVWRKIDRDTANNMYYGEKFNALIPFNSSCGVVPALPYNPTHAHSTFYRAYPRCRA